MFLPFIIVVFEALSMKRLIFKIILSLLERVQIYKRCWKTKEFVGPGGLF